MSLIPLSHDVETRILLKCSKCRQGENKLVIILLCANSGPTVNFGHTVTHCQWKHTKKKTSLIDDWISIQLLSQFSSMVLSTEEFRGTTSS